MKSDSSRYSPRAKSSGKLFSRVLATGFCGLLAGYSSQALAGSVFVSGHDSDFHAIGGNTTGAQNIIFDGLNFVRNGNTAPVLFIQSSTANIGLGDHLNSELGLQASGYSPLNAPGNNYVKVNATQFATANLSLFSAIFVPSDHGGTLTGDDLEALNARSADILGYVNAGGGLIAFAEDGFHTAATDGGTPALFGFLPFLATSAPQGEFEGGNTLTPLGVSMGLLPSDINGNFSHNIFTSTGGMDPVDFDANGEILSLATRSTITRTGVPDAFTTLPVFAMTLGLVLWQSRRKSLRQA